jgi:hypothetical protein
MTLDNILDQAAARGEQRRQMEQADMEAIFAREITAKLASLIAAVPVWIRDIRTEARPALNIVDKARRTEWSRDQEVNHLCREIETVINQNPQSIQVGLDMYKRLSWQGLLNQKGD